MNSNDLSAMPAAPAAVSERRARQDRRHRVWWSLVYGSFNPRRRRPPRRESEQRFHSLDWHSSHLLGPALGILLLSVADALMTVGLLDRGADEINPVMALVVNGSPGVFAIVKMSLTGLGVMVMVILARYRFLKMVRVDIVLYGVLCAYAGLLAYEFSLLLEILDGAQI